MISTSECVSCSQNNWRPAGKLLQICKYCGLTKARDNFFIIHPQKIYTESYYHGVDYLDYASEQNALAKNFSDRIKRIKKIKKYGCLLDIGCAYGYFLSLAKGANYHPVGVEVNKAIAKIAADNSGARVYSGDLLSLKLKSSSFDIITMFDVIEHLKNPDLYIKEVFRLLKRDGLLVIETGNIGAILPRLQGNHWRLITPPTHLYYFSPKTISVLLARAGFKTEQIKTVGFNRTIAQILYRLNQKKFLLDKLKFLKNFSVYLNTYDLMFIVARKDKEQTEML